MDRDQSCDQINLTVKTLRRLHFTSKHWQFALTQANVRLLTLIFPHFLEFFPHKDQLLTFVLKPPMLLLRFLAAKINTMLR